MDEIEVISEGVVFKVEILVTLEEILVGIEIEEDRRTWRQSRLRERGLRTRSDSSSRSQSNSRVSTNRDRVKCFKC